jgi:hypothetical protein
MSYNLNLQPTIGPIMGLFKLLDIVYLNVGILWIKCIFNYQWETF